MAIENNIEFREDVFGLATALDALSTAKDVEQRKKILDLMQMMLRRIETQVGHERALLNE